jgi:hypothetical protein
VTIGGGRHSPLEDPYESVDLPVAIVDDGLRTESLVTTIEGPGGPMSLTAFFEALAADWRGKKGELTWKAIEHDLAITAKRDDFGHVLLGFERRSRRLEDTWSVRATVRVEPGEEMSAIAAALRRLLAGA